MSEGAERDGGVRVIGRLLQRARCYVGVHCWGENGVMRFCAVCHAYGFVERVSRDPLRGNRNP